MALDSKHTLFTQTRTLDSHAAMADRKGLWQALLLALRKCWAAVSGGPVRSQSGEASKSVTPALVTMQQPRQSLHTAHTRATVVDALLMPRPPKKRSYGTSSQW